MILCKRNQEAKGQIIKKKYLKNNNNCKNKKKNLLQIKWKTNIKLRVNNRGPILLPPYRMKKWRKKTVKKLKYFKKRINKNHQKKNQKKQIIFSQNKIN